MERCDKADQLLPAFVLVSSLLLYLFLIILCTMASVVRPFPLSTVRRIPLLLGSCTPIKQLQMKMTQVTVMHPGGGGVRVGFLQHTGQIHPCPGRFLSSRDIQDPPVDKTAVDKQPLGWTPPDDSSAL